MNHPVTYYFTKTFFFATCLVLGCSSGGTLGCGSSSSGGPAVDSDLLGVYQIDTYQGNQAGCDQPTDIDPTPQRLVLYSFVSNDSPDDAFLGGIFCSEVVDCRDAARQAPEPLIGYSFRTGDDASGWTGFAIAATGAANDQCRADVQLHTLTAASGNKIDIETRTVETVFPPVAMDGSELTCRNADALAAVTGDLPCKAIIVLNATFEASL